MGECKGRIWGDAQFSCKRREDRSIIYLLQNIEFVVVPFHCESSDSVGEYFDMLNWRSDKTYGETCSSTSHSMTEK